MGTVGPERAQKKNAILLRNCLLSRNVQARRLGEYLRNRMVIEKTLRLLIMTDAVNSESILLQFSIAELCKCGGLLP